MALKYIHVSSYLFSLIKGKNKIVASPSDMIKGLSHKSFLVCKLQCFHFATSLANSTLFVLTTLNGSAL